MDEIIIEQKLKNSGERKTKREIGKKYIQKIT